ncbi:MAG: DUF4136 domain-containing protein [Winogradskyella sp.]|nr:DUF4136 domain-containing protein [Winogradskyella sp.]
MKFLKLIMVLVLLTSCGSVVNYDYEKTTDFSQYTTYNFFTDMETGLSDLDNKRLIRAIDDKLQAIGLQKTDNPSFRIDIQSEEYANTQNSNFGIGVGGTGRNTGGGVSVGIPIGQSRLGREIIIEFVDDSKNGMFWQAVTNTDIKPNAKPQQREADFVALVEKVFSKYPPKR